MIASGLVSTVAGQVGVTGATDGAGTAAKFFYPNDITTDGSSLYVADTFNSTIRKIVIATGAVTTIAGSSTVTGTDDGVGATATFYGPAGISTDGTNLYVADSGNNTIRKIVISTGAVTTIAGLPEVPGATNGTGTTAMFNYPLGLTSNGSKLFVVDSYNNTIRSLQ